MRRDVKAFLSFFFGVLWFVTVVSVIVLLIIPQVCIYAYGKEVDFIDDWCSFMERILNSFKEI